MKLLPLLAAVALLTLSSHTAVAQAQVQGQPQHQRRHDWEPYVWGVTDEESQAILRKEAQSTKLSHQGDVSFNSNDLDKASEYYKSALVLNPANPWALAGAGYVQEMRGNLPEALKSFHAGLYRNNQGRDIAMDDIVLRMHYVLLLLAQDTGNLTMSSTAVGGTPAAPVASTPEPSIAQKWKDWREGVSLYEDSIILIDHDYKTETNPLINVHFNPNERNVPALQAMAHVLLGMHYYSFGMWKNEPHTYNGDLEAAIKLQPDLAIVHYMLGRTYMRWMKGKLPEAKAEFERASELDKGSVHDAAAKELSAFKSS